mmetsp:Transcript_9559/g.11000  ORF Transcript_9559/g.11000 Transcript_9559/m.11000 type:complete len:408 (+) Transcript_9559:2-1225(+)
MDQTTKLCLHEKHYSFSDIAGYLGQIHGIPDVKTIKVYLESGREEDFSQFCQQFVDNCNQSARNLFKKGPKLQGNELIYVPRKTVSPRIWRDKVRGILKDTARNVNTLSSIRLMDETLADMNILHDWIRRAIGTKFKKVHNENDVIPLLLSMLKLEIKQFENGEKMILRKVHGKLQTLNNFLLSTSNDKKLDIALNDIDKQSSIVFIGIQNNHAVYGVVDLSKRLVDKGITGEFLKTENLNEDTISLILFDGGESSQKSEKVGEHEYCKASICSGSKKHIRNILSKLLELDTDTGKEYDNFEKILDNNFQYIGKNYDSCKKTPLRSLFVAAQKTDNCALWNLYPAIGFDLDVDGTKKLKDEIRAVQIKLSLDIIDNWPKPENDEYGIHDFVKQVLKEIANLKVERLG